MSFIEICNIKKVYGKGDGQVIALNDINLKVEKGEMLAIMGSSGSGKSTLLNILGFLDKQTEGQYYFNGELVEAFNDKKLSKFRNKHIGFVVQNFALIQDYTVFENIKVPLDYTKVSLKDKKKKVDEVLKYVGIFDKKEKLPRELSGGQNQRVAIARALVNDPDVILADEPTGALDSINMEKIMELLKKFNDEGKTIIIITHDNKVAKKCKRILYIEDGEIKGNKIDD